jgi:hypothetical protein
MVGYIELGILPILCDGYECTDGKMIIFGGHDTVYRLRGCAEAKWDCKGLNAFEIQTELSRLRHNGKLMYFQI